MEVDPVRVCFRTGLSLGRPPAVRKIQCNTVFFQVSAGSGCKSVSCVSQNSKTLQFNWVAQFSVLLTFATVCCKTWKLQQYSRIVLETEGVFHTGVVLASVETHQAPNSCAAVSPCGKFIACAGTSLLASFLGSLLPPPPPLFLRRESGNEAGT